MNPLNTNLALYQKWLNLEHPAYRKLLLMNNALKQTLRIHVVKYDLNVPSSITEITASIQALDC